MDDNSIMPFGKHKGKTLANVPDSYLLWLNEQSGCNGELKKYIVDNLDALKKNTKSK